MAQYSRILLTGVHGQVGSELLQVLPQLGEVIPLSRSQLDLSNPQAIRKLIQETKPNLIVNPAAYTAVDKSESEHELAFAVNATAPGVMAEEAAKVDATIVHYSTDYLFDGLKPHPYAETDPVNPLGVYGASKLAGEEAIKSSGAKHLILRTSWVYGPHGKNFLKTILRLAQSREQLTIVADQHGAPTCSKDIANATVNMLESLEPEKFGTYHLTNGGDTTWHGFASAIIENYSKWQEKYGWPSLKTQLDQVVPISTLEYPTPAKRPLNSRLDNTKLRNAFGIELPHWRQSLNQVMDRPDLLDGLNLVQP